MRIKPIALAALIALAGASVAACRDDHPGHWGDHHRRGGHHHDRDDRDGYRGN
jgi:hypothetical protein